MMEAMDKLNYYYCLDFEMNKINASNSSKSIDIINGIYNTKTIMYNYYSVIVFWMSVSMFHLVILFL